MAQKKQEDRVPNFLEKHLREKGGHCGRGNPEMARMARLSGLSIHTVQSLALQRREFSADHARRIERAIQGKRTGSAAR